MSAHAARIAVTDQLDAATRDAKEMLADFLALLGDRHTVDHADPGPFAVELLRNLDERTKRHRQRFCTHLRRSPDVAWLFGWAPERLHCQRCAFKVLRQAYGTAEDYTCDVCRRESDNGVSPVMGAAGPMVVLFGACDDCYARETGAAA
ncbi:MAG: hypothetical protein KY440_03430 [Actinobacteria bacterium]|nr:hypothetical protein [Actinomycetota bacterium]